MRITYDPEVDALYITLRTGVAQDSVDIEDGVTVELDAEGHVLGMEILDARRRGAVVDQFAFEHLSGARNEQAATLAQ
jgi:uncharacterized protein YuzE